MFLHIPIVDEISDLVERIKRDQFSLRNIETYCESRGTEKAIRATLITYTVERLDFFCDEITKKRSQRWQI